MKKILATILALTMVLSLGAIAFADDIITDAEQPTGSATKDVTVKCNEGENKDLYRVEIAWGDLSYTYFEASNKWSTTNHKYEPDLEKKAGWGDSATNTQEQAPNKTITLTNHSPAQVKATFSWAPDETNTGFTGTFEQGGVNTDGTWGTNDVTLNTAKTGDGTTAGTEQVFDVTFKLAGTPSKNLNGKVGTISVELTAAD